MIEKIFDKYPNATKQDLMRILTEAEQHYGCLSDEVLRRIGFYLHLSEAEVRDAVLLHNAPVSQKPQGAHHIKICCGTACHVKGSRRIINKIMETLEIEPGQHTANGMFSFEVTPCQDACRLAPLVSIDGEIYMDSTPDSVVQVINKLKNKD